MTILALRAISAAIDWAAQMRPAHQPLGALRSRIVMLADNLSAAQYLPTTVAKEVHLDLAKMNIVGAREALDEIELAVAQALEAARRE